MVRESVAHNQGLMYVVVALFFVCLFVFCGIQLFVFQLLSRVEFFMTSWTALCRVPLSFTISQNLLRFMSTESLMLSNHLILCLSLLLLSSIFPSIRIFSSESDLLIRWTKSWHFYLSISPSSEYSGLISFRMDWLDLLAIQGTLKNLLQHHSSKATILQCSAFFMVQLSHPYMTTGKTIALTRWTFFGTVMTLPFNMLAGWSGPHHVCPLWCPSLYEMCPCFLTEAEDIKKRWQEYTE